MLGGEKPLQAFRTLESPEGTDRKRDGGRLAWKGGDEQRRASIVVAKIVSCVP